MITSSIFLVTDQEVEGSNPSGHAPKNASYLPFSARVRRFLVLFSLAASCNLLQLIAGSCPQFVTLLRKYCANLSRISLSYSTVVDVNYIALVLDIDGPQFLVHA